MWPGNGRTIADIGRWRLMSDWTIWGSFLALADIDDSMMKRPALLRPEASHALHSKHAISPVRDNDGYASYAKVTAVAACNDRGRRSVYSDFGKAVWCAFPSNDFGHAPFNHPDLLTPGIWTIDRQGGTGYNSGLPTVAMSPGDYTNSFGGTSSACPGAAGVAALILSVNPALKWQEVKDVLKRACDRIDPGGGQYDAAGHSPKYGFGRLNALTAIELAKPRPQSAITIKRTFDAPIPDMMTVTATLEVADNTPVEALTVAVNIKHTFIGDLVITLEPPAGIGVAPVVLHDRAGGSANNLKKQYDAATTPALSRFTDKGCKGTWTLRGPGCRSGRFRHAGFVFALAVVCPFRSRPYSPRNG